MPDDRQGPAEAKGPARHILSTASTMIGISTTLIGFVKLLEGGKDDNHVDEYAAGIAVIFLFSAILSYSAIRTEAHGRVSRFCEQVADNLFIVGLVGITAVAFVFAYELL